MSVGPKEATRAMTSKACRELVAPGYEPDLMRLDDVPIDTVRAIKSWLYLRPFGDHKIIVIHDVDRLGQEAGNALLKMLEEPPAYAKFFLTTSQPADVMSTIASRCQRVDVIGNAHELSDATPSIVADLQKMLTAGVAEKILYAKKLADDEHALDTVRAWLSWVHSRLAVEPALAPVAHGLIDLSATLAEPRFNRRLAIEHFLLTTPRLLFFH